MASGEDESRRQVGVVAPARSRRRWTVTGHRGRRDRVRSQSRSGRGESEWGEWWTVVRVFGSREIRESGVGRLGRPDWPGGQLGKAQQRGF